MEWGTFDRPNRGVHACGPSPVRIDTPFDSPDGGIETKRVEPRVIDSSAE